MNKVRSLFLITVLLIVTIVPMGTALAQDSGEEEGPQFFAATVSVRSALAVYAEPSLSSEVITTLANGTLVGVLGSEGVWSHIFTSDGVLGWTFTGDLVVDEDPATFNTFLVDGAYANVRSGLAIYAEPSISSEVITSVEPQARLLRVFTTEGGLFDFVILEDGTTGYTFSADVTVDAPRAVGTGTLNQDRVLFRSAPEASTDTIIRPLDLGEEVLIVDLTDDFAWYEVRIGDEYGYVASRFVDTDAFDTTIAGIAELAGFDTLLTAVAAADPAVAEALSNPEASLTVFAPSNEAFEALGEDTLNAVLADQEQLTSILLYHVVDGALLSSDVVAAAGDDGQVTVPTLLEGASLDITIDAEGNVFVNGIQVEAFDIQAKNGVIHVIGGVLLPE